MKIKARDISKVHSSKSSSFDVAKRPQHEKDIPRVSATKLKRKRESKVIRGINKVSRPKHLQPGPRKFSLGRPKFM
jgi:hypothetical protein